jgi:hypothetical protein
MNTLVTYQATAFIAVIEQAGLPALRVAFSIAVLVFLYAGVLIFRRRRQFFDRDPNVENDFPCRPTQSSGTNPIYLGRADAGSAQHLVPSVARMT